MLTISSHKGNANQTTLRFHLTPVRIAIRKTPPPTCVGEDAGKKKCLYAPDGNASWYNHSGKNLDGS
jgi:hypothetical protein